ncbi:hypothetical protein EGT67_01200 [Prescottella agglutinans]|uniref:Uncharacterized protein n=1 Tax=Prescottella agglutinans TaxID=1644129 RepID=A0A3S3BWV4_9NOCA|nr:DUF5994 family protein [Prescottella agglutinans]RVW11113.1 hypothetical protein EGT67_01200 [Prescottella agglutinans]
MTRTPAHFDLRRDTPSKDGGQPFSTPTRITRLLFSTGSRSDVDGVWWPRTQNLSVELHDLVVCLTPRLGPVARIHFDWNAVSTMQRHIDPEDGLVVTGPEADQSGRVMRLYSRNGSRVDIAIVEPGVDTAYGYKLMARILDPQTEFACEG